MSAETTFDTDLTAMTAVHDAVARMTQAAHRRLLESGRAARTVTVYEKGAFWVWNLRSEVEVRKGVKFIGVLNNVFDVNQHPIFIALDQNPCTANIPAQNGSCGNSIPGREFWAGIQVSF